jgi:HEAT repeat protein
MASVKRKKAESVCVWQNLGGDMKVIRTFGRMHTLGEMKDYYARDDVLSFLYDECQMRNIEVAFRQKRWPINPTSKAHLREIVEETIKDKIERVYRNSAGPIDDTRLAKFDYLSFHSLTSITSGEEEIGFDTIFEADMQGWRRSFEDLVGVVKMLDNFGVCYRMKYSGVRSLHLMIPFGSFPKEFNRELVLNQRKEIQRRMRDYFQRRCGMQKAHRGKVLRLAYSLNEDNGLVSLPILSEELSSFRPWETHIYNVTVDKPWHGDIPPDASGNMLEFLREIYDDAETIKKTSIWISYGLEITPRDRSGYSDKFDESSVERWLAQLESKGQAERVEAAWNLMTMPEAVPVSALEKGLADGTADVRWYMTEALQKRLDDHAVSLAGKMLMDNDSFVRISAIDAFALAGENASRALLDSIASNVSGLSREQLYDLVYAISKIELEDKLGANELFSRSDMGLVGIIRQTEGDEMLENPVVLVRKLGNLAIEMVFESAFASDAKLQGLASALLKHWMARYGLGSETDTYIFLDWLIASPVDSKARAKLLLEMLEATRKSDVIPLLTCVLLCYPDAAFPLLMEKFWSQRGHILHSLCRMGTRFGEALLETLSSGDIRQQTLALAGLEELARALNLPQYRQASSEELALAARITEGIAPPPKEYRDPDVLKRMVDQVARLLVHHHADIRESSIRVLGLMQAHTYLARIRACVRHDEASTREAAIFALGEIGDADSIEALIDAAQNGEPAERRIAIEALGRLQAQKAQPVLMQSAGDADSQIRQAAVVALGAMENEKARAGLQELARSQDRHVAKAAAKALYTKRERRQPSEMTRKRLHRVRGNASPVFDISVEMALRSLPEMRPYEHSEITHLIARICHDYSGTRRALIIQKLMDRADDIYRFTESGKVIWRVEHFIVERYLKP